VLFLTDSPIPEEPHLHVEPLDSDNPAQLLDRTASFVAQHPSAAVVLSGVEQLLQRHRLEDIVATLDRVRSALAGHGPLRVGFNPRRVTRAVAVALGGAVAAEETHATLEALANPIRRKVLQRLAEAPASFGDTMEAVGLGDSPKMAFHLRKLVETGLVLHQEETYRLTTRGDAAVRLLTDATFLPPVGDSGNLAFPGGRSAGPKGTRSHGRSEGGGHDAA
jgi:DNA-binding transcriptional ArsR family regulator